MRTQALTTCAAVVAASLTSIAHAQCGDVPGNPPNDIEGAGFGAAAVMNAAGTVAVVSGPGYDSGDGNLNFFDVSAFLVGYGAMDPIADFTGDGVFNFFDASAFLTAYIAGCP